MNADSIRSLKGELSTIMDEVLVGLLGEGDDAPILVIANDKMLGCAVRIRGGWNGQVFVQASLGLANSVAIQMFGEDARITRSGHDARDALREIANIVAGNLKPLFGDHNMLGLPEDLPGDVTYPHAPELEGMVEHRAGRLEVRVFEDR